MIQDGKLRWFAMGHAIPVRTDYTAGEVRRFAQRAKDAAQARRLLAIAGVLGGASREESATIGGMDRQTLRLAPTRGYRVSVSTERHGMTSISIHRLQPTILAAARPQPHGTTLIDLNVY